MNYDNQLHELTEWQKMRSGQLYDWTDPEIDSSLRRSRLACERFNRSGMDHEDYREALENMIRPSPSASVRIAGWGATSPYAPA